MKRVTGIGGILVTAGDQAALRDGFWRPLARRWPEGKTMRPILTLAVLLGAAATPVAAEEWPQLRHGMWEFNRSIETVGKAGKPQTVQTKKCTSPTDEMRRQNETLSKAGCKFSPLARAGSVYTYSAACRMQGMSGTSKSVLTVDGDSAYTIRVESDFGGEATREFLQARRTGDCPR